MPIYEYACNGCGKTIDVLQKVSDPAPAACTECGATGTLSKVVSRTSFVLKGGGWYADLYASKKDGSGGKAPAAANSDTASAASSTSTAPSSPAPSAPVAAAAGDKK